MGSIESGSNPVRGIANVLFGSQAWSLLKRILILTILLGGLAFLSSERSVVKVKAEDCGSVMMSLSECYAYCGWVPDYYGRLQCFTQCEFTHQMAGATCNWPTHSPMMVLGGGCDAAANGQRAYDNCIAGTLSSSWQEQYLIYMAYYGDMETSCAMIGQSVEAQGCY